MINTLAPIQQTEQPTRKYLQVTEHLRGLIKRGEIKPGTRLPSIRELARQWNTNHYTIHTAMIPLMSEGLIGRKGHSPRTGTFVRGPSAQITTAAIYCGTNPWDDHENSFFHSLYREIKRELEARCIHTRLFLDARDVTRQSTPWPELATATRKRAVQGVIGLMLNQRDVGWLNNMGVPYSLLFSHGHDVVMEAYSDRVLDRLAALRCKSVGMIVRSPGIVYARFAEAASARGMMTCEAWLKQQPSLSKGQRQEEFGCRAFHEIWSLPQRPEGIFVYPDWVCRGAVIAALELGVRVPQDLKLILFRNAGLDYLCPWRVPMIVADVHGTAANLVDHLVSQHQSGSTDPVIFSVPSKLVG